MADIGTAIVREMRGEDIEELAEALQWSFRQIDKRWQETVAGWREVFVAEVEGRPVGTVSINERPEQPRLLHLFALDVSEPLRNRGIGTQLVDYVEAEAQSRGLEGVYLEVALSNVHARRLYERLGYAQDKVPFQNSWQYTHEDGTVEERVEMMIRVVKRAVIIHEVQGEDVVPLAAALERPVERIQREYEGSVAGKSEMFVAEVDGRPVGAVSVSDEGAEAGCLRMFSFEVAPAMRSRGIGTRLIVHVEECVRARRLAGVSLDVATENEGARRLYERLGYEVVGEPFSYRREHYDEDGRLAGTVMEERVLMVKRG